MVKRIFRAINAIFFSHVIVRLGSLILVPLCLKYWTANLYGEYLALFASVSYLTSLDFGMQQAAVNRLTQAYARGELAEYRVVQHTALAFYLLLATTVTLAATGAWLLPVSRWLGLKITSAATAKAVILMLAVYVMWSMPVRLMTAIYQTTGNLARSQWVANVQQVFIVIFSGLALVFRGGMLAMASIQVLAVALVGLFVLVDIGFRFPQLFPGTRGAKFTIAKELATPSLLFALLLVGNLIAYQGGILLVSSALGGVAVVAVSIAKAVIDVVRQGLYSINLAFCPDFASMEARREMEKLRRLHWLVVVATSALTLAVAATLWYEGSDLIAFWTRGRITSDPVLLRLFLILLAFQTPWAASSTVATSINRHRVQATAYFFAAVLSIVVAWLLIHSLGAWAIPVGLVFGEALTCYHFVIKSTCHLIEEPYAAFALRFWGGFATVAVGVLSAGWLTHELFPRLMLLRVSVVSIATLTVAVALTWILWLKPADRAMLLPKLRPALRLSEVEL
jgi:O-antigen/teichoic acid export membrane protein